MSRVRVGIRGRGRVRVRVRVGVRVRVRVGARAGVPAARPRCTRRAGRWRRTGALACARWGVPHVRVRARARV